MGQFLLILFCLSLKGFCVDYDEKVEDYSNEKIIGCTYIASVPQQGEKDLYNICTTKLFPTYIHEKFSFRSIKKVQNKWEIIGPILEGLKYQEEQKESLKNFIDTLLMEAIEKELEEARPISRNNSWNAFQKRMKGRSYTPDKMSLLYKIFQPSLIQLEPEISPRLSIIKLVNCSLNDDVFCELQEYLLYFKSLKEVHVDKNSFSLDVLRHVVFFSSACGSLQWITVRDNFHPKQERIKERFIDQSEEQGIEGHEQEGVLKKIIFLSKDEKEISLPVWWQQAHQDFYKKYKEN